MSITEREREKRGKLKQAKSRWLSYAFLVGILGFINILTNIPDLNVIYTHTGIQIGMGVYIIFLVVCLIMACKYQHALSQLKKKKIT